MRPDDKNVAWLASVIERYCAAHPHAADTVEGVWRWWLAEAQKACSLDDVAQALAALAAAGHVVERRLADGTVIYACARREG